MTKHDFALFDTTIGRCGIAWRGHRVAGVQFPEASDSATRARLLRRFPDAREAKPPTHTQRVIDDIVALLDGETCDMSDVELDMERISPFHQRVYEAVRTIPPGTTFSYGEIAAQLGSPRSARAVGQALGRNPFPIIVPCHRVVAANGKIGGFSANGGTTTKRRLLAIEGGPPPRSTKSSDSSASTTLRPPNPTGAPTSGAQKDVEPDGDCTFAFDPAKATEHIYAADPGLARLIDAVGPFDMQLKNTPSTFRALAEAIVYQQLNGKAAASIFARVCAVFPAAGDNFTTEDVQRASDVDLRGAGLSRSKLNSLRDLAQKSADGQVPQLSQCIQMEDEEVIECLTEVRGIGRWTAEMFLMFRLGRPDVLPADDYGIRKGFAIAFGSPELPTRKAIEAHGIKWAPYRTVASWYLWRAAELTQEGKLPPLALL
jgi:methylated-DNA-[protein]-cysteine S-methyltransferase